MTRNNILKIVLALGLLPLLTLTAGCSSNGVSTSASVHYSMGYYDSWYWNDRYYNRPVVVVPPDRPGNRPPIGRPPVARPTPLPARPMPRPTPRARAR